MAGLIIKVELVGNLEGFVSHTSYQKNTIPLQKNNYVTSNIFHTDRKEVNCIRSIRISEEVVANWQSREVPNWSNPRSWNKLTPHQKTQSHVSSFDEGRGVSFEYLE